MQVDVWDRLGEVLYVSGCHNAKLASMSVAGTIS